MDYLFTSSRLGFRNWKESDKVLFAKMNADKEVLEYFPALLTKQESDNMVDRLQTHFEAHQFTFFAVEIIETKQFIGFIGLINTSFTEFFTPCMEIGWRLAKEFWHKGYATEGAERCLAFAFDTFKAKEIYSFTPIINLASEKVMQRIGMEKKGTFNHPKLDDTSVLKEHLLYRIER